MAETAMVARGQGQLSTEVLPLAPANLVPRNVGEALQMAELMSKASLVPEHLRGKVADCFLVVEQAQRWGLSPFAVAQCTSSIRGKLMFEGKLVAAVVNGCGGLARRLSYTYAGSGNDRTVVVSGVARGETEPREVTVALKDARTQNESWKTQPDQQLAYHGARVWARRHMPELMLGIYSPEEIPAEVYTPPKAQTPPAQQQQRQPAKSAPAPTTGGSASPPSDPPPEQPLAAAADDEMDPNRPSITGASLKAVQAAITKLAPGWQAADAQKLRGEAREAFIRGARLAWLSWAVGRPMTSTLKLYEDEVPAVLAKANAGEVPS